MQEFEKLGIFYLGKIFDSDKKSTTEKLFLYDAKDLTTHAVCIGMTGSGKTGLGIAIMEEASLDKIPVIAIDPKGDLGNLLLAFPKLSSNEFLPWIDLQDAERKNMDKETFAKETAKTWEEGLKKWGESKQRIKAFNDSSEKLIYTPASHAGIPISILGSFKAPSKEEKDDRSFFREKILSIASSLLGLIGIKADPIQSKEHTIISSILDEAWRKGIDLDIPSIIQRIQNPPFDKIGALDLETFFPSKERTALAVKLNQLLASPGFQSWMEGESLNIQNLLYTKEGKPKISILSIAHLSDSERMFFVTLFLNELLSWARKQPGTSSLRALFYMDEIFGYFPPTSMPPSKLPMLTLLKQARAYGLGLMLSTQNPVDLDYKGLSNCGTWFIGKLQTEKDKKRVLEGLQFVSETKNTEKILASMKSRIFLMRNVHEKETSLFETRWTLSYLRGPLTLSQIGSLMKEEKKEEKKISTAIKKPSKTIRPALSKEIEEFFYQKDKNNLHYQPFLAGFANVHFMDKKNEIDLWQKICRIVRPSSGKRIDWDEGENISFSEANFHGSPSLNSSFEEIPVSLMQSKNYKDFEKSFFLWLYQNYRLVLYFYAPFNLASKEGETEKDFRVRISLAAREKRDEMIEKIRNSYGKKIEKLQEKLRKAQSKLEKEKQEATFKKTETYLSLGETLLGAVFGKTSKAGTTFGKIGKISKESRDVTLAEKECQNIIEELQNLEEKLKEEIEALKLEIDPEKIEIDTKEIALKKSGIEVDKTALLWKSI